MVCKRPLLSNIQILDIYTYNQPLSPRIQNPNLRKHTQRRPQNGFRHPWWHLKEFSPKHPMELVHLPTLVPSKLTIHIAKIYTIVPLSGPGLGARQTSPFNGISTFTIQFHHFCPCRFFFRHLSLLGRPAVIFCFWEWLAKPNLDLDFLVFECLAPTWICVEEMLGKKVNQKTYIYIYISQMVVCFMVMFIPWVPRIGKKVTFSKQIQVEWRSPQWCCYGIFQKMVGGGNSKMVSHHVSLIFFGMGEKNINKFVNETFMDQSKMVVSPIVLNLSNFTAFSTEP